MTHHPLAWRYDGFKTWARRWDSARCVYCGTPTHVSRLTGYVSKTCWNHRGLLPLDPAYTSRR